VREKLELRIPKDGARGEPGKSGAEGDMGPWTVPLETTPNPEERRTHDGLKPLSLLLHRLPPCQ